MLEVFTKLICFILMALVGFYVIKIITKSEVKLLNIRSVLLLSLLIIIQMCLYNIQYTATYTITVFLLNIIIYKKIFNITLEASVTSAGILMFILFFGDLITTVVFRNFYTVEEMRSIPMVCILSNLLVTLVSILVMKIKYIKNHITNFYMNFSQKKSLINTMFFILLTIGFSLLAYKMTLKISWSSEYTINFIIMLVFFYISYIYIKNKNSYSRLSSEYDNLFNYIQNFEEWIEKEQLNRHEYKNQLAVLRCLTKDKKVKTKIDEILDDNINLEGDTVQQLKDLPKGGLKGLMYYKTIIAQKNKIKLTFDISIERNSIINKLTEKDMNTLCKLIGIYFDNAIEAASETRKKNILVEVYDLKDKVNIVISNTFKKSKNFDDRNKKGISTKGEGRGNGLHFANRLLSKNNWISEKQEVIDGYYIQQLSIKKLGK